MVTKDASGAIRCMPIRSRIVSLFAEQNPLQYAVPGGLIGVGTTVDPTLTRADRLVGQVRVDGWGRQWAEHGVTPSVRLLARPWSNPWVARRHPLPRMLSAPLLPHLPLPEHSTHLPLPTSAPRCWARWARCPTCSRSWRSTSSCCVACWACAPAATRSRARCGQRGAESGAGQGKVLMVVRPTCAMNSSNLCRASNWCNEACRLVVHIFYHFIPPSC